MTDVAAATAAPTTIRIGGKEYRMSPFTDADVGEMDQWVRAQFMRTARASLPNDATPEQRRLTEEVALDIASRLTFISGRGQEMVSTLDGVARLIWQSLHRHHPDVTLEQIRAAFIANPDEIRESMAEWARMNPGSKKKRKGLIPTKTVRFR